jgi:Na+/H+ antiporter NhaD/arsenite permease-like protein
MLLPIIILSVVFLLIITRKIGNLRLQIWHIMLFGAVAVLATLQITPLNALKAINLDVIFFLFGMFVIGEALEHSGYLSELSYKLFKRAKTTDALLLFILFGAGFAAAFLMNDTIAIIGTPIMLLFTRKHNIEGKILLLTLCFAVTIGSVLSPIGNPQNLLIAVQGNMPNPFVSFLLYLFIPTMINLMITFFVIKFFYRTELQKREIVHLREPIHDEKLTRIVKISLLLVFALILLKILFVFAHVPFVFRLTYIAIIGCLPIIIFSKKRLHIVRNIDWSTLVFFASMFILMQAVWDSGFFQSVLDNLNLNIISIPIIFAVAVLLSQLISNVPLVALYLPLLMHIGVTTKELVALAAASTIAGNLLILGAASNVIIIQNAESKSEHTITFWEFARIGIPLTIINCLVYLGFFWLL